MGSRVDQEKAYRLIRLPNNQKEEKMTNQLYFIDDPRKIDVEGLHKRKPRAVHHAKRVFIELYDCDVERFRATFGLRADAPALDAVREAARSETDQTN